MALKGFSSEFAVLRWLIVPHNTITWVFHVHLFKNQPNNRENTDIRNRACPRYCSGFIFFFTFKESSGCLTLKR